MCFDIGNNNNQIKTLKIGDFANVNHRRVLVSALSNETPSIPSVCATPSLQFFGLSKLPHPFETWNSSDGLVDFIGHIAYTEPGYKGPQTLHRPLERPFGTDAFCPAFSD